MGTTIRYMGAKRDIALRVASVVETLPAGPCLDLFAGVCSVPEALSLTGRETWCNDVQFYAGLIARALVTASNPPPSPLQMMSALSSDFVENLKSLQNRFADALNEEHLALRAGLPQAYSDVMRAWRHIGNDPDLAVEAKRLRCHPDSFPYRLATLTFSHGYFGLRQSISIDSLRYALDRALTRGELSEEQVRWGIVALLQATSCLASSPGHFAEYLHPHSETAYSRIRSVRVKSMWLQFQMELRRLTPIGSAAWRAGNRVYCGEADALLRTLSEEHKRPAVVYADPPYSEAQYSRYYHVLETLTLYDYPAATGLGRYRDKRYQTPFSNVGTVRKAFGDLVRNAASLGSALVLSYPSNGLLRIAGFEPQALLAEAYESVRIAIRLTKRHSTLGASPGSAHNEVEELIYVAEGAKG